MTLPTDGRNESDADEADEACEVEENTEVEEEYDVPRLFRLRGGRDSALRGCGKIPMEVAMAALSGLFGVSRFTT